MRCLCLLVWRKPRGSWAHCRRLVLPCCSMSLAVAKHLQQDTDLQPGKMNVLYSYVTFARANSWQWSNSTTFWLVKTFLSPLLDPYRPFVVKCKLVSIMISQARVTLKLLLTRVMRWWCIGAVSVLFPRIVYRLRYTEASCPDAYIDIFLLGSDLYTLSFC